jgi:hypothetical protein
MYTYMLWCGTCPQIWISLQVWLYQNSHTCFTTSKTENCKIFLCRKSVNLCQFVGVVNSKLICLQNLIFMLPKFTFWTCKIFINTLQVTSYIFYSKQANILHIEPNLFEIKQLILLKSNWFFCYLSMHHQQVFLLFIYAPPTSVKSV